MTWVLNYTMPCCLTFAHWLPISSQWLVLNRVSLNHISYCYTLDDRPYFVILVHYCVFILFIYFKLLGARSSYLYCYSLPTISLASRRLMSVRHRLHQHWRKAILIHSYFVDDHYHMWVFLQSYPLEFATCVQQSAFKLLSCLRLKFHELTFVCLFRLSKTFRRLKARVIFYLWHFCQYWKYLDLA